LDVLQYFCLQDFLSAGRGGMMESMNKASRFLIRGIALIVIMMTLVFGSTTPAQASASHGGTNTCDNWYVVQWGDTLYKIGLKFGVYWPTIAANNGIGYPYWVYAGQYLCISGPGYYYPSPSYPPSYYPGYPYYDGIGVTVTKNIEDKNVSIQTSWLPRYEVLDVLIGKCQDAGASGKWVGQIATGAVEGIYTGKYKIPSTYYGVSCLSVRLVSEISGRIGTTNFTNGTGASVSKTLDFLINSVDRNNSVTITIYNAAKGNKYKLYIGHEGTGSTGGTYIQTFIPDSSKPATLKLTIPAKLAGSTLLDLRIVGINSGEDFYHTFRNKN